MNSIIKESDVPETSANTQRCLVVGGSGRIGGAVCRLLKDLGADLSFTYFKGVEAAGELTRDLDISADLCDLSDAEAAKNAIRRAAKKWAAWIL